MLSRRAAVHAARRISVSRPKLKSRALLRAMMVWITRLGVPSSESIPSTANVSP